MHGLAELFVFGLAPLLVGGLVIPQSQDKETLSIHGEVVFLEGIALPAGAVLTLRLASQRAAGFAGAVIAEELVRPTGQAPISFNISFDAHAIKAGEQYTLEAQLSVDGDIRFASATPQTVDPVGSVPLTLMLARAAA